MIQKQFTRTQMLLGSDAMNRLAECRVAVFGVGGVGGYVVEVLARSGVGSIDLIDNDTVSESNVNRQVIALMTNVGRDKVDVAAERIHAINPACKVTKHKMFYVVGNADELDLTQYDYVADCIDTVSAKMELVRRCTRLGVPLLCSMGAANKMDPTAFRVADSTQTMMDPLARIMRKRLRREGINHFKCVYSAEKAMEPVEPAPAGEDPGTHHNVMASNAFVPAAAGIVMGGEIIKDLVGFRPD